MQYNTTPTSFQRAMVKIKQTTLPFSVQKIPFLKFFKKWKTYILGVYKTFYLIYYPKDVKKATD